MHGLVPDDGRWLDPAGQYEIDWGHPLAQGLVLLWTGTVDHVTGLPGTHVNGAGRDGVLSTGTAARFVRVADQRVTIARNSLNDVSTNRCSVACIARRDEAIPAAGHVLISRDNNTTRAYTMDLLQSPTRLRFYVNGSASALAYFDPPPAQGEEFMSVGTWDGNTARIYWNGREGTSGATTVTAATSASEPWMIGRRAFPSFEGPLHGDIGYAAVWNRTLRASETTALYAAPFQMLRRIN